MLNKKEFFQKIFSPLKGGLFFVLGILIAGVGYALVTLTIGEKQDNQNDGDAGRLTASEFNQLLSLTRGLVNDEGDIGVGIAPEGEYKLHVDGNVIATGEVFSDSNITVEGNVAVGVNISVPDELCQEDYIMDGFNEDGSISCIEIPNLEATITNFSAIPGSTDYNTSVDISWTHENVSTCTVSCTDGCSDSWDDLENTALNTIESGLLTEPASFTLDCIGTVEGTDTASLDIDINPAEVTLTSDTESVFRGGSATLTWAPQSARTCQGSAGGDWAGAKDVGGGEEVVDNINNDTTYAIRCTGWDNQYDEDSVTVAVMGIGIEGQASAPGTPINLTATAGMEQISLSWQAGEGGVPTAYELRRADVGAVYTEANTSYIDTDVEAGTPYTYTIQASNEEGLSNWATPVSATPEAAVEAPEASVPGEISVFNAAAGDEQITLTWDAPDDGGSPITGYRIERDLGGGATLLITSPEADIREYSITTGLTNGITYSYRIRASNIIGNSVWAETSATPEAADTAPAAPVLEVVAGDGSVTLTWNEPDDGGDPLDGYNLQVDNGVTWETIDQVRPDGQRQYSHTGLTNGNPYTYRVSAYNGIGTTWSNEVSATPQTPEKFVFVTSLSYRSDGNFGGAAGANQLCQAAANNSGNFIGKTFRALVSDNTTSAVDNIRCPRDATFVMYNGLDTTVTIANGCNDLLDGTIGYGISYTENKDILDDQAPGAVWTGSNVNGTLGDHSCNGFTTNNNNYMGISGASFPQLIDSVWINEERPRRPIGMEQYLPCNWAASLYCIEQ